MSSTVKDMKKYYGAYLLVLPVVLYYVIFAYKPMYGLIIAFKDFKPGLGIWGSPWADNFGFEHFIDYIQSFYFGRTVKNTLTISITSLIFGFPAPIIFALLLNEIKAEKFKRVVQTITYMPHFISTVIVCSMVVMFVSEKGIITSVVSMFTEEKGSLLNHSEYFVPIYVISGIWQNLGWNSIIYLAALSGVDPSLYEAAKMDGAGRFRQTVHVTIPGIMGTIVIMLLLNIGGLLNVGYEKIILLYNESIYETADVISTYVYRKGLENFQYSFSTAVNLFNSAISFILVMAFNKISKKVTEISLW
ncbi:MAG: sugar ABC transporter permease [Lachnospiraceae bacterium]|nr:sugar ABC transporter permease [Lachnospiraceae bacterium]